MCITMYITKSAMRDILTNIYFQIYVSLKLKNGEDERSMRCWKHPKYSNLALKSRELPPHPILRTTVPINRAAIIVIYIRAPEMANITLV